MGSWGFWKVVVSKLNWIEDFVKVVDDWGRVAYVVHMRQ